MMVDCHSRLLADVTHQKDADGCGRIIKSDSVYQNKADCPGLDQVTWGGFVGSKIIGKSGVHLNTRMYYSSSTGEMPEDEWTVFLMVDHQMASSIGNLTISTTSLQADLVYHQVEEDCSTTVFQFQSNDFHGPDFSNRKKRAALPTFNKVSVRKKKIYFGVKIRHILEQVSSAGY